MSGVVHDYATLNIWRSPDKLILHSASNCNRLMEVQAILDKNRCPIVQIIDDDKGVHLVAAVNLYEVSTVAGRETT